MGGSAPAQDPNIGIAALKSANVGEMMLDFMKKQSEVTNGWAAEDRDRYQKTFLPLQDKFIADAQAFASPERKEAVQTQAAADVGLGMRQASEAAKRQSMAMGVNPASGRAQGASVKMATDQGLAMAGARNMAGRQVEEQGRALEASAINMGAGMAVNPATSMGISNGAMTSGASAAMQGYGQQGSLLNAQYQNQMQAWQANQSGIGALGSALGSMAGLFIGSSEKIKHDKKPVKDALGAVREMPVEAWTYNEGEGDGGRHIGPYAEDFKKATGMGDGKKIDVISMMGLTLGAVRELDAKVDKLASQSEGKLLKHATGRGLEEAA